MEKNHSTMQADHHTPSIMIIDDSPANLNFMSDILSLQGYKVRAFPNGRLALHSAQLNPPDLILLDINMPELNGFEVCVMLKAHPALMHTPVIFISALTDTREKVKAFECGGVDYITKPFEPLEIKARIKTHLNFSKTERLEKEIQKRIRTEKQYYAQLDSFADAIIHISQAGEIVYANPVVETYFGYSREELIGQKVEILIPREFHVKHIQYREGYMHNPVSRKMSTVNNNIRATKKNGDTFPVNISLNSLYSEEGLLVSAEIRDITEQVRLKNKLETQRQFFEDAFSKTPDGLIFTDSQWMIIFCNPSLSNMLGYRVDELTGKQITSLLSVDDKIKQTIFFNQNISTDTSDINFNITFITRDGNPVPTEISVVPVRDNHGDENTHFIIIRDISERLQMERERTSLVKQLVQAQKMEALGQLTGGVAHDFNNILASMMGFTELSIDLLEELAGDDTYEMLEKLSDYLDEIYKAGKRATLLIEQMLIFSRTGNNGLLHKFDISTLVTEAIKMLRPVLPTSIRINAHIEDNISPIMADPVQVHQILMNICINARDAMNNKGNIEITLKEISVSKQVCTACQQELTGNYLDLSIADTGPGIDANLMEHLFEPFFTTKNIGKGTGMGLAMVHGIVHHHRGHIIVESEAGHGTRFRILFPMLKEKQAHEKTEPLIEHETI